MCVVVVAVAVVAAWRQLSPAHLLAPSDLGGVEIVDAYAVRSRTQEASFTVDRTEWGDTEQLYVKCVATIEGYPQLTRERIRTVRLTSDDRLNNDRLVNVKSGGSSPAAGEFNEKCARGFWKPQKCMLVFLFQAAWNSI